MANIATTTKLYKGENAVANITSVSGLEYSRETVETTTLDDTDRKYIAGIRDAGEVTIEGNFDIS